MSNLNIANTLFDGFNDKEGLMICGYEWGWSKADQKLEDEGEISEINFSIPCTFSNKIPRYGESAKKWRYDNTIKKWFSLWGCSLNEEGLGSDFDKCIVQTNWALEAKPSSENLNYYLQDENLDNFITHINQLRPKIIFFMGNQLLTKLLRSQKAWDKFILIMGGEVETLKAITMPGYQGKPLAYINKFEKCTVIGLPHPSGPTGVTNEYIKFCKTEIEPIIMQFKKEKNI